MDEHLKSIGFTQTVSDRCLYVKEENGDIFIVTIHVDDIILAGKTDEEIAKVKESMAEWFQAKDMGELKYILGLQVIQENGKIWIGQPTYTESILKTFGTKIAKHLKLLLIRVESLLNQRRTVNCLTKKSISQQLVVYYENH